MIMRIKDEKSDSISIMASLMQLLLNKHSYVKIYRNLTNFA